MIEPGATFAQRRRRAVARLSDDPKIAPAGKRDSQHGRLHIVLLLTLANSGYRSRAVIDPRGVLGEFGVEVLETTEVRAWDSNAEAALSGAAVRPEGTEGMSEDELAALVTRDSMIGTGLPKTPSARRALAPPVRPWLDEVIEQAGIGSHWRPLLRRPLPERRFDLVIDTQRRVLTTLILRRLDTRCFVSGAANFLLWDKRPPGDKPSRISTRAVAHCPR